MTKLSTDEVERRLSDAARSMAASIPAPPPYRAPEAQAPPTGHRWLLPAAVAAALTVGLTATVTVVQQHSTPSHAPAAASGGRTAMAPLPSSADTRTSAESAASSPSPSTGGSTGNRSVTSPAELDAAKTRIRAVAAQDPLYNDLVVDAARGTVIVYRADAVPDRLRDLYDNAAGAAVPVTYAHALLTASQSADLIQFIAVRLHALDSEHVVLDSVFPDPAGATRIGYDPAGATPSASDLLMFEKYGPGTVVFVPAPPAHSTVLGR